MPLAEASATGDPEIEEPLKTKTFTSVVSLALPLKEGVESLVGEGIPFSVTSGLRVSTLKLTGPPCPVSPVRVSVCSASTL